MDEIVPSGAHEARMSSTPGLKQWAWNGRWLCRGVTCEALGDEHLAKCNRFIPVPTKQAKFKIDRSHDASRRIQIHGSPPGARVPAPSARPEAKPVAWATTSGCSPPAPSNPSSVTPAASGTNTPRQRPRARKGDRSCQEGGRREARRPQRHLPRPPLCPLLQARPAPRQGIGCSGSGYV